MARRTRPRWDGSRTRRRNRHPHRHRGSASNAARVPRSSFDQPGRPRRPRIDERPGQRSGEADAGREPEEASKPCGRAGSADCPFLLAGGLPCTGFGAKASNASSKAGLTATSCPCRWVDNSVIAMPCPRRCRRPHRNRSWTRRPSRGRTAARRRSGSARPCSRARPPSHRWLSSELKGGASTANCARKIAGPLTMPAKIPSLALRAPPARPTTVRKGKRANALPRLIPCQNVELLSMEALRERDHERLPKDSIFFVLR